MPIEFPRLSGTVAFDTETRDPDLKTMGPGWAFPDGGEVIGFSMSWDAGRQKHYWPIAHAGGGNYPREKCLAWLRSVMKDRGITWIMYNRLYDEGWLRRMGIPVKGKVYDVYTAIPLLDEYRYSYKLDDVAKDYLGVGKNEDSLMEYGKKLGLKKSHVKENLWKFPAAVVAPYAADDAWVTLKLWEHVEPLIKAASPSGGRSLEGIFNLETELLPILLEMRWRGIRVDLDRAEKASKAYKKQEAKLAKLIASLVGVGVDIWSNESLAVAFDRRGIKYRRTKTGLPSFTAPWLKTLSDPLPRMILEQRKLDKTRNTFLDAYILNKAVNGRIHPQVNPLPSEEGGAVTGRPSVTNPNMNNLPNVDKDPVNGRLVRGCMLPEEGEEWAAIDYSQQEPRLMVHFAAGSNPPLPGAAEAAQRYIDNPRMDFHNMMSEISGLVRKQAKNIFLGRCYGMGGGKYCLDVGLPVEVIMRGGKEILIAGEEGQRQLDRFNDSVPWVEGLSKRCERAAKALGQITTILGRRCRFGGIVGRRDWFYKALNRLIQGSAADQTKKAMIDAWGIGHVPLVTVYDELGFSVANKGVARLLGDVMENAVPLRVPVVVDIELGPSWGDSV